MKNFLMWALLMLVVILWFFIPTQVQASEKNESLAPVVDAEKSPAISGSAEFIGYGKDFSVWLYAERKITNELALSMSAAKSKSGFQEVTFGPVYYLTSEIQIGVSLGAAQYTRLDDSRLAISVFGYLETDNLKAEALFEKYGRDPKPYYRVYAETPVTPISEKLAIGVHGEQYVGWGPRISWSISKNVNAWLSPLIERQGGNVIVGGLQFTF
jgi:hypothetical protein